MSLTLQKPIILPLELLRASDVARSIRLKLLGPALLHASSLLHSNLSVRNPSFVLVKDAGNWSSYHEEWSMFMKGG